MIPKLRFCVVVLGVFLVTSVLSVGYILYQVIYFSYYYQSYKYPVKKIFDFVMMDFVFHIYEKKNTI